MRDVFAQRDKQRRSIRKELNALYREFMEASSANDLKSMIFLDKRIRSLKETLLRIDPEKNRSYAIGCQKKNKDHVSET